MSCISRDSLSAGLDRVYEMGKMFRNEGMDKNHNPEFTNMECYMAYGNMESVMDITEQIVYKAAMAVNGSPIVTYQGKSFDVTPPWNAVKMEDAVKEITGVDFGKIETDEEARSAAVEKGMDKEEVAKWTRGKIIAEMFEEFCEDVPGYLDGPVFVIGHPVEVSPLSKRDPQDPRITRRFEAYINPGRSQTHFLSSMIDRSVRAFCGAAETAGSGRGMTKRIRWIRILSTHSRVGMPPTGGLGVGVDRVIMLLTDFPEHQRYHPFPDHETDGEKGCSEGGRAGSAEGHEKAGLFQGKGRAVVCGHGGF